MTLEIKAHKRELVKAHLMMRRAKSINLRRYWRRQAHHLKGKLAALKEPEGQKDAGVSLR